MNTLIQQIDRLSRRLGRNVQFMEVCGTHTMVAFRTGLRQLLPADVKLISGPGCPVCVTDTSYIDAADRAVPPAGRDRRHLWRRAACARAASPPWNGSGRGAPTSVSCIRPPTRWCWPGNVRRNRWCFWASASKPPCPPWPGASGGRRRTASGITPCSAPTRRCRSAMEALLQDQRGEDRRVPLSRPRQRDHRRGHVPVHLRAVPDSRAWSAGSRPGTC